MECTALTEYDFCLIERRIQCLYILNGSYTAQNNALKVKCNGEIDISKFICVTYFYDSATNTRTVVYLKIHGQHTSNLKFRFKISFYYPRTEKWITLWVADVHSFRREFLGATENCHFFKVTFLFDPDTKAFMRLNAYLDFIKFPDLMIDDLVWYSPTNCIRVKTTTKSEYSELMQRRKNQAIMKHLRAIEILQNGSISFTELVKIYSLMCNGKNTHFRKRKGVSI